MGRVFLIFRDFVIFLFVSFCYFVIFFILIFINIYAFFSFSMSLCSFVSRDIYLWCLFSVPNWSIITGSEDRRARHTNDDKLRDDKGIKLEGDEF